MVRLFKIKSMEEIVLIVTRLKHISKVRARALINSGEANIKAYARPNKYLKYFAGKTLLLEHYVSNYYTIKNIEFSSGNFLGERIILSNSDLKVIAKEVGADTTLTFDF